MLNSGLIGFAGGDPFESGFFRFVQDGADLVFQINENAGDAGFATVVVLQNTDLEQLSESNFIVGTGSGSGSGNQGDIDEQIFGGDSDDFIVGFGGNDTLTGGVAASFSTWLIVPSTRT